MTPPNTPTPVLIDLLTVRAGRRSGVFLEAEVRGELVYMPLTPAGARAIAADLARAAECIEGLSEPPGGPLH